MRNLWEYKLGNPNESSQQPQTQKRCSYHTEIVKLLSKLKSSNATKKSSGSSSSSSSSYALWLERSKTLPVQEHNQLWYWKQNTAKSGSIGVVFLLFFGFEAPNFETNQNGFLHNNTMKKTQVDFLKRIMGEEGGEWDAKGEHSRQRYRHIFQPMWHIPVNSANHTGWNLQSMRWFAYKGT